MALRRGRSRNQNGWVELTQTNKWKAHWYEYVKDSAGNETRKHHSQIVGAKADMRKFQAQQELYKIVGPVNSRGTRADDRVTLEWFWANKFKPMREGGWTKATRRGCDTDWGRYVQPKFGATPLKDVGMFDCQILLNNLAGEKNLSESVVKRVRVMLSSMMECAVDLNFLPKNPAKKLVLPVCKPTPKPTIPLDELASLLDAIKDVRDHLILSLGCFGGVTSSELFGLTWGCYKGEFVEIRNTAYQGELQTGRVKRQSRHRNIYLPEQMRFEMEKWKMITKHSKSEDALIFPNTRRKRGPMWPGVWLQKHIAPIAEGLGITVPVTFQVLRRSCATRNQRRLKDLQAHLGHKNIQTTANVYVQEVAESICEMVTADYAAVMASKPKGMVQ